MQRLMKTWVRNIVVLVIFGISINLMYLALPISMMVVFDQVMFSHSVATLSTLMVGVIFSLTAMGLIDYFRRRMLVQLGNKLVLETMPFVLEKIHKDAALMQRQGYARGFDDLKRLRDAIVQGRIIALLDLPWMLFYLIFLFFIHSLLGAVATAVVFIIIISQLLLMVYVKRRTTIADVASHSMAEVLRTSLQHAELVASMGMLRSLRDRYLDEYNKILKLQTETDAIGSAIGSTLHFFVPLAVAAVFAAGVFTFFSNSITSGSIIAVVLITARLLSPFERSLVNMQDAIEAVASFKRLHKHISQREEKAKLSLPPLTGQVTAESVSVALSGKTVLHNFSFSLKSGESVGILGPASVGKTTLCKVLLGIWPATAGKVRLDGAEIAQWPENELRAHFGYMPQEPVLFPASVAENIARLQKVDSDKVVMAAQKAGVHEMILQLPHGYDTRIDQIGKNISSSQRQLISLARALYDTPRIVILDTPHANLDEACLANVFQAIQSMKREKITSIVVTDRTQLLSCMDKLLVIRDGQMHLFGPSKDVLNKLLNQRQQSQQAAA
jgi:PrtD family type I secretion system ABC transporter